MKTKLLGADPADEDVLGNTSPAMLTEVSRWNRNHPHQRFYTAIGDRAGVRARSDSASRMRSGDTRLKREPSRIANRGFSLEVHSDQFTVPLVSRQKSPILEVQNSSLSTRFSQDPYFRDAQALEIPILRPRNRGFHRGDSELCLSA